MVSEKAEGIMARIREVCMIFIDMDNGYYIDQKVTRACYDKIINI